MFLGTAGIKRFTDSTLPAGSTAATYEVTAVRSTGRGHPARFTVSLGVTGSKADAGAAPRSSAASGGTEALSKSENHRRAA